MKKIILLLFILPTFVFASSIECDNGNKTLNDEFSCKIEGKGNIEYEYIKGKINVPSYITCNNFIYANGLTEISPINNYEFNLKGTPQDNIFINFKCKVTTDIQNTTNGYITINNFSYNGFTEILKSNILNFIPSEIKKDEEKPRNTSINNLLIEDIKDDSLDFTFSRFITTYNIEVLNEVNKINPTIKLVDSKSTYEISKFDLEEGDNVIDILVTNETGDKNTYTLNIKRLKAGENVYESENDASVKNIEVTGQQFKFLENVHNYTLEIAGEVSSLDIKVTPTSDKSTVNIKGNSNIQNKSKIVIEVISENKEVTNKYVINIKKKLDIKEEKNYIFAGIIAFLVVVLIIIIVITNNRKYNKKKQEDIKNKIEVIDN